MPSVLLTLLNAHTRAFLRRMMSSISTARLMSAIVLLLILAWCGQTVASVLFREPYEPAVFRQWVAALLLTWTLWHFVRIAWQRPEAAVEWTPEEEYLIVAGPFTPRDQLIYRVAMVLTATLPKALLTILVLSPDLSWGSPAGIVIALVGVELLRMLLDIGVSILSQRGYWLYRASVGLALTAFVAVGYTQVSQLPNPAAAAETLTLGYTPTQLLDAVFQNEIFAVVTVPFFWMADGVTSVGPTSEVLLRLAGMAAMLPAMFLLMVVLERTWRQVTVSRERDGWEHQEGPVFSTANSGVAPSHSLPNVFWGEPLIWRQGRRAIRYFGSVVVALAVPVILLSPLMRLGNPMIAFGLVVCGALFYTFVLLPEAIKFDFRLDCDHMDQLKLLPMAPGRIVLAQLTVPVLLCCLFQAVVFTSVGVMRSIDAWIVAAAITACIPVTVLFVALDNLAFLLSPHRPTQEGFEAFLRTILKFTAKSLLILAFLLLLVAWAPVAAAIAQLTSSPTTIVFGIGVVVGMMGFAAASVACVIAAFRRFDVSVHSVC